MMLIPGAAQLRAQSGAPPVDLISPASGQVEPEGKVTIQWSIPEDARPAPASVEFELQQAAEPDFASPSVRYRGRDRASVLTGFPEGEFYFRVRSHLDGDAGPWSEPVVVHFDYIGMGPVWALVGTGSLMFFITVGAIVLGHFRALARARKDKAGVS